MAEGESPSHTSTPSFLEVKCKSSGKTRRFAIGTEAGFAVSLINRKLSSESESESESESPLALYIEAFKENEEPIAFGPNSVLVDYGDAWVLKTVTVLDFSGDGDGDDRVRPMRSPIHDSERLRVKKNTKPAMNMIGVWYVGKIILAFLLLFLLGTILTLALENLPALLSFLRDPK